MAHDMDLIRAILLDVEERKPACGIWEAEPFLAGKDAATVVEHLNFLINEGCLTGTADYIPESDFLEVSNINITGKGLYLLNLSRDEGIWKTAKEKMIYVGKSFCVPLLLEYLKTLAKSKLGL